jgi:hypothetical protein
LTWINRNSWIIRRPDIGDSDTMGENGGAKLDHGSGGEVLLRAA